jgi:glycosyltransferase involved in cell wall biosynthesis
MSLTIGITTFKHRYEKYFKPLIQQIKNYDPNIEIVVAINGEHQEQFDDKYRSDILKTISSFNNTYPIMFPQFRGLTKLWNSIIINSSNDYILMLNDDISITSPLFLNTVKTLIDQHQTSFKINSSWSHVVLKKEEVMEVGFFDERLLGIGEEDGFFEWKYYEKYTRNFSNAGINGITNWVDMSHNPTNTKTIASGKYSALNNKIMYETIFTVSENGKQYGVCPAKLIYNEGSQKQYPYEGFYIDNNQYL